MLPDELELLEEEELELLEDELELLDDELELEDEELLEELLEDDELLEDVEPEGSPPQPTNAIDAKADRTIRESGFHFISAIEVFQDCLLSIL